MNLGELFPCVAPDWVRYSDYEYKLFENSGVRVVPAEGAKAEIYNPMEMAIPMLVDALNIGRICRHDLGDAEPLVLQFVRKYGLIGLAVDLPLQTDFLSAKEVILGESGFHGLSETMPTSSYIDVFFPEGYLPEDGEQLGSVTGRGEVYNRIFSPVYGERRQWLIDYFSSLNRRFEIFYEDPAHADLPLRTLRYGVVGGNPPKLGWIFPSLKSIMDMALAQCVSSPDTLLRVCKNCGEIYYNEHVRSEFCTARCRNQYNVRAFRSRQKGGE
ncbi:MAG: hypothetical protein II995_02490 [Oscillospiraceae bacterium]|nr:hypothetical protein [Oscillospiraceae bacterium]